ncbi:replication initiation and membrane attachment protein [Aerococcus agrisoli]|uniref:Replication initiation and membrane attachment protein n=1 Tax=Aerococcus agrisoli TaxID=2487350 RepID=A0A3N4G2Q4_9LACT|nr:DnaD domain protein [Aerococcus agrisoli]RPA57222.1 replication initiation and membrane attachment protein [Aerococcus agrisoli]
MTNYPWQNLDPKGLVQITQPQWISDIDQQVLLHLYQPIIGGAAYALYQTLYANIEKATNVSKQIRHHDLMEQMVWGKEPYIKARRNLEAIGLLQVFEQKAPAQSSNAVTVYQLQAPLNSKTIFADPIMSTLLMDRLGQPRYNQLIAKFSYDMPVDVEDGSWTDVTATFKDVFRLPSQYYPIPSETEDQLISQNRQTKAVQIKDHNLNIGLLKELMQSSFISEKALTDAVIDMAISLNQIYGYDEVDIQKLATAAADLRTNTIDLAKMQRLAVDQASDQSSQQANQTQQSSSSPTTGGVTNANTSATKGSGSNVSANDSGAANGAMNGTGASSKTGLTDRITATEANQSATRAKWQQLGLDQEALEFADFAKSYPPIAFASSIKEQKGGYLTKAESNTITELIRRNIISPAVMNIMIQYVLLELDEPNLSRSFLERIADDWKQQKISEPEAAMLYLKKRQKDNAEQYEKRQKNRISKGRYQTQKESVKPKWLDEASRKEKYEKTPTSASIADESEKLANQENAATINAKEAEIRQLMQALELKEGE